MSLEIVVKGLKSAIKMHEVELECLNKALTSLGSIGGDKTNRKKYTMSADARRRISEAQRKRWAAVRKGNKKS